MESKIVPIVTMLQRLMPQTEIIQTIVPYLQSVPIKAVGRNSSLNFLWAFATTVVA